jgi:hypothetical protein
LFFFSDCLAFPFQFSCLHEALLEAVEVLHDTTPSDSMPIKDSILLHSDLEQLLRQSPSVFLLYDLTSQIVCLTWFAVLGRADLSVSYQIRVPVGNAGDCTKDT